MRNKLLSLALMVAMGAAGALHAAEVRYVGGDVSLLPTYEAAKAQYKDSQGKPIADVLKFCYDEGMNAMRVRLFVDPSAYPNNDPNACQDLEYILPLCKRITEQGFDLMLDFHYSDTWADPGAQWTPKAWQGLSDQELYQKIYDYTKETLETLKSNGVVPAFIQPGNEISYGMLWGAEGDSSLKKVTSGSQANWSRFGKLLNNAISACREVCPDAAIVLHTERVEKVGVLTNFYKQMKLLDVDYDIIGLSYYPYYHGKMSVLDTALTTLEQDFPDKRIMIVETGYSYKWEVPGTNHEVDYPYSEAGQNAFAQDLVDTLLKHPNCDGLFWWWFEYNAKGTTLQNWYNAPLFDSNTGRVTKAFATICSFGTGHAGVDEITADGAAFPGDDAWYDLQGRKISEPREKGLYIHGGKLVAY